MNDFSAKTLLALGRKGISIMGKTVIPDPSSDLPFANGETGYTVNDNGCGRVMTFRQVLAAAA